MSTLDWVVMLGTLFFIVGYGVWKTRGSRDLEGYLKGNNAERWWTIGLSVMATQASAITFLSTPGQAYFEGMGFVQFYFGLPLAMVIIAVVFIPLYYRLKVYTAYEFLENRFDLRTRVLTASLFLLSRGLAAGITIYAPAIILSQILGWPLELTILFIGILVIVYTVSGGTRAVSQTHKQQMAVIFTGMFIAFGFLVHYLGDYLSFGETLQVAGKLGKMNIIDWNFDPTSKYNVWSGLIGGLFLQLSYFGTDQSQVQRYLSGANPAQSRLGLMFNGLLKVPMQFFILLVGVLVFMFYQFHQPPVHFNRENLTQVQEAGHEEALADVEARYQANFTEKRQAVEALAEALRQEDETAITRQQERAVQFLERDQEIREDAVQLIGSANRSAETQDDDYIFISFVMDYLPVGLIGLLLAVIFSAAMSSTSAELNALGSTATVDLYKRLYKSDGTERQYLNASRLLTLGFGLLAILFAMLSSLFENLIEAVNILGSLFYGTILGIFLVAFFIRHVHGRAVFIAAILAQAVITVLFFLNLNGVIEVGYLWFNLIAPAILILLALLFHALLPARHPNEGV